MACQRDLLILPEERAWYQMLMSTGLTDTYRLFYPKSHDEFSWFDYRSRGFEDTPKRGLRIDHILCTDTLKMTVWQQALAMISVQWISHQITHPFGQNLIYKICVSRTVSV